MTNVAEIFHKLKPDDMEFMLKAWKFFPHDKRLDLALLPFVDAHAMYMALELARSGWNHYGSKSERRQAERIQKKLKRAITRPYIDRKNCRCPICAPWKTETARWDDSAPTLSAEDLKKAFIDMIDQLENNNIPGRG